MTADRAASTSGGRPDHRTVDTIGHSTRSESDFLELLQRAGVRAVADVRAFPSSRRHPHFNSGSMADWLHDAGVEYVHFPGLGGRRRPRPNSANGGWREAQFQGYADHLTTPEFERALAELELLAGARRTAIMCAEAVWWRCHRRLISDALTVRGWLVEHLGVGAAPARHELPSFAVVQGSTITYPREQGSLL